MKNKTQKSIQFNQKLIIKFSVNFEFDPNFMKNTNFIFKMFNRIASSFEIVQSIESLVMTTKFTQSLCLKTIFNRLLIFLIAFIKYKLVFHSLFTLGSDSYP